MKLKIRRYNVEPGKIPCGTEGSFGIETMEFEFDPTWDGLDKAITFYPPRREPISVEIADEPISVPWEATDRTGSVPFVITGVSESRSIKTRTAFLNVFPSKKRDGADPTDPWEYIPGENITIVDRVISAKDTTYTPGSGISISDENVISATGGGGTTDIFWVTYNTTTFAEISTAIAGGKLPVMLQSNRLYVCTFSATASHKFTAVIVNSDVPHDYGYVVDDTDNWTSMDHAVEVTSHKVTSVSGSSSDDQYPSAKLLYDSLLGKVNEPVLEGTNGQVLTTDGNGGRSWTSPGSSVMTFPGTLSDNTFTLSSHNYKDISDYYDAGYLCVIKGGGMSYIVTSITVSTAGGQNLYTIYALALGSAVYRLTSLMGLGTSTTFTRTSATLAFS